MKINIVRKARKFAKAKHKGQLDDCGKNYFKVHVEGVVKVLRLVTKDKNILAAAYLHDTLEDTDTSFTELHKEFGMIITKLVWEVTHEGKKDTYGKYFPRLKSRDAILIKFADRLHNLSRMDVWDEKRVAQYLRKSKFWKDGSDL